MPEPVAPYDEEVRFKVGQRVEVGWNLEGVPLVRGTIIGMSTMFPHTPELRKIRCRVWMDERRFSSIVLVVSQEQCEPL